MENISKEEDFIIDQLGSMERNLDKFFDIACKNSNNNPNITSIDDTIYSSTLELDANVKDVQKEIDDIQENIIKQSESYSKKIENLKSFQDQKTGAFFNVIFYLK